MGLFSDKCPECGATVRRTAKFCSVCGKPGPKSWFRCPQCRKWVGGESAFCWSCHTALHPEQRGLMAGGRWQRTPGVYAERFEMKDLGSDFGRELTIEAGTAAVLLERGAFAGVLQAGRHTLESLMQGLLKRGDRQERSIILIDDGEVVLPLRVDGLRTQEDLPVEFYGEVALGFQPAAAERLVSNLMKAERQVSHIDLAERLAGEVRYAVENLCGSSAMEDLVKDPDRRLRLENTLQESLAESLDRLGLTLLRVASAEFAGAEYEALRDRMGQTDLKRREIEFDQRLRELLAGDEMHRFRSEGDLEEYVAQLAQEKGISAEQRQHELALLTQVHRHELEAGDADFQIRRRQQEAESEIGIRVRWDDYQRDKLLKDEDVQDRIEALRRLRQDAEVRLSLDWRRQKQLVDREDSAERLRLEREDLEDRGRLFAGMNLEVMLATIADPGRRQNLLDLHQQLLMAGRPPAAPPALPPAGAQTTAGDDAIEGLRESFRTLEKEVREGRRVSDDVAERLGAAMKKALDALVSTGRVSTDRQ